MCIKYASCVLYVNKNNIVCTQSTYCWYYLESYVSLSLPVYIYIHYKDNIIEINIVCICILRALYIRWDVHTYCLCVHPACNSLSIYIYLYNRGSGARALRKSRNRWRNQATFGCPGGPGTPHLGSLGCLLEFFLCFLKAPGPHSGESVQKVV